MYQTEVSCLGGIWAKTGVSSILARLLPCVLLTWSGIVSAATLSGSFATLAPGTTVDLSAEGQLDWGHWGLVTEWSYNHKYGVAPQITCSLSRSLASSRPSGSID